MDDLIRREDVLRIITNGWNNHYSCKDMCDEIKEIPTTYNVDKVVERIKEVQQDLNVLEIMCHLDSDSTIQNDLDNFLQAVKNEILRELKAGGVNG